MHELEKHLRTHGAALSDVTACFLDLGGDARLSTILFALTNLQQLESLKLLVVKSEEMVRLKRNTDMLARTISGESTAP